MTDTSRRRNLPGACVWLRFDGVASGFWPLSLLSKRWASRKSVSSTTRVASAMRACPGRDPDPRRLTATSMTADTSPAGIGMFNLPSGRRFINACQSFLSCGSRTSTRSALAATLHRACEAAAFPDNVWDLFGEAPPAMDAYPWMAGAPMRHRRLRDRSCQSVFARADIHGRSCATWPTVSVRVPTRSRKTRMCCRRVLCQFHQADAVNIEVAGTVAFTPLFG